MPPASRPVDVVVVGGGLAGGLLALSLKDEGLSVVVIDEALERATALSYGGVAWWAGGRDSLGRLIRRSPARWRWLEARYGSLGWRGCGLRLHGGSGLDRLLRLPFAQVDAVRFAQALPPLLHSQGIAICSERAGIPAPGAAGWRVPLASGGCLEARQVVLAAGAGCRELCPALPGRLRISWAGVLELDAPGAPSMPQAAADAESPWLMQAQRGCLVQPRHWQRRAFERRADRVVGEDWIVDAGLAPWGRGVLAGQVTWVRTGVASGPPPDPLSMERRLRQGLAELDPTLGRLPGIYHQVPVAFCLDGLPLVGPVQTGRGLWVFTGFSGAFAQVPVLAPLLAAAICKAGAGTGQGGPATALARLSRLGVLPG